MEQIHALLKAVKIMDEADLKQMTNYASHLLDGKSNAFIEDMSNFKKVTNQKTEKQEMT